MSTMPQLLSHVDPEISAVLSGELERQRNTLMMIPSENYASLAVLQAQGSVMTNQYAEGYPRQRYYNGCRFMDEAESLAISRCKELFGAEHANVQLNTGASANMCAYYALLNHGDKIMAMDLNHGGHLTHGKDINFSGKYYNFVSYGVSEKTEVLELDEIRELVKEHKPRMIVVGASAYPRVLDFEKWHAMAAEAGALLMADISHIAGLVAAGVHPSPIPWCDVVTSTTHKTLRGPRGAIIMSKEQYAKQIDKAVFPGIQAGPLMHAIAAKAVCFREAMGEEFRRDQKQTVANCKVLADVFVKRGFRLVTGGTDNHLLMIDLENRIDGKVAADHLEEVGIVVNKNMIPFDTRTPVRPSGIRLGTPALTTRGMKEGEMETIGGCIADILANPESGEIKDRVKSEIAELCAAFPLYREAETAIAV
ncbi:MAG: serine hydroxymethyltransferase [Spirochaetes bacterium]|nr:serine hydroxymethyltransferase [Spirochaetota bacterium]